MKINRLFFACFIICCNVGCLSAQVNGEKKVISVPVDVIKDKIRGGLLGQMIGVMNGLPHEGKYIKDPGNVLNYIPSLPEGAWTDDDTDFEWVYICEMQKTRNVFLSKESITDLWMERINKRIWCSNRYARYLMDIGIKPPYTGYSTLNPWAGFNLSGQFLCETFGLLAPGMPQTAAKIGLNYTTVAINNEPAQTTQLFTAMIATAFLEKDINKIMDAGIASLDPSSIIIQIISDVKKWYSQYPDNWKETRRLLQEKYTQEGGTTRDHNGHELNTGSIIAALLYGKGDFAESVRYAFNYGWDADCNAATVGTIVGVTYGYRKMLNHNDNRNPEWLIVDRYKNKTRDNMPMDETITSFADRLIELFEMINEENGGVKTLVNNKLSYQIPAEHPAPVIRISSIEEQKKLLKEELEMQISKWLVSGNREEKARAAYLAVCLDLNLRLAKRNPTQWEEACYDLSGHWKIMHNIFYGNFKALKLFRNKFEIAGFKTPAINYDDEVLYNDSSIWKEPKGLTQK